MIETFNDIISIGVLVLVIAVCGYIVIKQLDISIGKRLVRREVQYYEKKKKE